MKKIKKIITLSTSICVLGIINAQSIDDLISDYDIEPEKTIKKTLEPNKNNKTNKIESKNSDLSDLDIKLPEPPPEPINILNEIEKEYDTYQKKVNQKLENHQESINTLKKNNTNYSNKIKDLENKLKTYKDKNLLIQKKFESEYKARKIAENKNELFKKEFNREHALNLLKKIKKTREELNKKFPITEN